MPRLGHGAHRREPRQAMPSPASRSRTGRAAWAKRSAAPSGLTVTPSCSSAARSAWHAPWSKVSTSQPAASRAGRPASGNAEPGPGDDLGRRSPGSPASTWKRCAGGRWPAPVIRATWPPPTMPTTAGAGAEAVGPRDRSRSVPDGTVPSAGPVVRVARMYAPVPAGNDPPATRRGSLLALHIPGKKTVTRWPLRRGARRCGKRSGRQQHSGDAGLASLSGGQLADPGLRGRARRRRNLIPLNERYGRGQPSWTWTSPNWSSRRSSSACSRSWCRSRLLGAGGARTHLGT